MAPYSPMHVTNNILSRAFSDDEDVTLMKLQRILYLVAHEYATEHGSDMFEEQFKAWRYGPVLTSVHNKFSCYNGRPIDRLIRDAAGGAYYVDEKKDPALATILDRVWNRVKPHSPVTLSRALTQPGTAWSKAYSQGEGATLRLTDMQADTSYTITI